MSTDTTPGVSFAETTHKFEGMLGSLGFEEFQEDEEPQAAEEPTEEEEVVEASEDDGEAVEEEAAEEEEQSEVESDAEQSEMPQTLAELAEAFEVDEEVIRSIKVPTKVDGESSMATLGELVKGYQLEKHSQRKLQALAEERKSFEQERQQAQNALQMQMAQSGEMLNVLRDRLGKEIDGVDWKQLREDDPAEFAARRSEYTERVQELQQFEQGVQQRIMQQQQEAEQKRREQLTQMAMAEQAKLVEAWTDWGDPDKREIERSKMREVLISVYNFSEQEVNMTMDHRSILMARDAMRYREMMSKGEPAKKRVLKAPKTLKKGVSANLKGDKLRAKRSRLKQSGDVRDMASALFDMIPDD